MRHYLKDCTTTSKETRKSVDDNLPYSVALKAKSNLMGKITLQLGSQSKKIMHQKFYVNDEEAKKTGHQYAVGSWYRLEGET